MHEQAINTYMNKADEVIERLKRMGELLVPYTFPRNDQAIEEDITILKTSDVTVDGYEITLHYNKADYQEYDSITLQVLGKYLPFLPFSLVVKLAKKALGSDRLYLAEVYQDNRKVYCWTLIMDKKGNPQQYPVEEHKSQPCQYEGFEYTYMDPSHLNFY